MNQICSKIDIICNKAYLIGSRSFGPGYFGPNHFSQSKMVKFRIVQVNLVNAYLIKYILVHCSFDPLTTKLYLISKQKILENRRKKFFVD